MTLVVDESVGWRDAVDWNSGEGVLMTEHKKTDGVSLHNFAEDVCRSEVDDVGWF